MNFNYASERNKFDAAWEKTASFYAEQGMSQEAIDAMHDFDWDAFKAERIWALHTQEMGFQADDDDDTAMMDSPLLKKFFDRLTTQYDTYGTHSRYWWLEEIESPKLVPGISKLTDEDKELLTLMIVEGYTQEECAVKLHSSQSAISRKFTRIIDIFTKN